jgi:hypothetical protein
MLQALRRSRASIATWENLRIVRTGPRSERGGTIAWTRRRAMRGRHPTDVLERYDWRETRNAAAVIRSTDS